MLKTIRGLTIAAAALAGLCGAIPATAQTSAPTASAAATDAPATNAAPLAAKAPDIVHVAPTPGIGMPTDKISIQPQETAIGKEAVWFHNTILVPMMAIISLLVLVLLIWVIIRYRAARNPTPSRTHHNTLIEVIWTLAPVLVLICIAVPSIRLIAHQYDTPKADLTVKVIGNQWYWTYQYPDNGDFEVVSNMLPEQKDAAKGKQFRTDKDGPRLLAVDERMVVPVGAVVKIITTSNDVIHSFALPAAWTKMDAVPGRLNETWFKIDRPGVYFGQCSELCGARHGFMPIAVEVVSKADFVKWVAFKGGTMPGPGGAKNPDATSDASPAVAGSGKPEPTNAGGLTDTGPTVNATAAPAKTSQPAVAQN